ncbi:hypothetical protein BJX66DRAFT_334014 [Aspergillus keveii]|uniref:Ankyrin repeat protein n=1 Tax=Aspergillus keveii TaxID=714993 RepID=A0ABR4GI22_9EURO
MGWNKLPRELQLMILKELSDLDTEAKELDEEHRICGDDDDLSLTSMWTVWQHMVSYFLVCKTEIDQWALKQFARYTLPRSHLRSTEMLLEEMDEDRPDNSLLQIAVRTENIAAVRLLLEYDVETGYPWIDWHAWSPSTPLTVAVNAGNIAIAQELLQGGASVFFTYHDLDGLQQVSYAGGDGALIRLLVQYGLAIDDTRYELYGGRDDWAGNYDEETHRAEDNAPPGWWLTWHPLEIAIFQDAVSAAEAILSYDNSRLVDIARGYKEASSKKMKQLLESYMQRAIARCQLPAWHHVDTPGDRMVLG